MRYCEVCSLPIGFIPVWKNGRIFRWKAVNPDGSPHYHVYQNEEVPWQ